MTFCHECLLKQRNNLLNQQPNSFNFVGKTAIIPLYGIRIKKFIFPKPGKESYNLPKSYRPISLTSVTGKMLEQIINTRLIWWLESQFKIDLFQFAYQKNFSTTQALTYFIDSIKRGFCDDQHTVAALIDLEGAFDSVWCNGVLYKL